MPEVAAPPEQSVTVSVGGEVKVLYVPTPVMLKFHAADFPFVLTSGGRNSGKSHALRWDAHMRNLAIPGHRALLLRRTFPQLRGSHFDKADMEAKLLGCKPLHKTNFNIDYPNGSKLQFGHCDSDTAILDYLSQEWDWIGFDELTTFTFDQFIRISASARTTAGMGRRAYVRAATNPIGIGATWVRRYFIEHSVSEEENPDYRPEEWFNIPANMDDNPYADLKEYERKIAMLPSEALRRAYRHGEWLIEGQFFPEFKEKLTVKDANGEAKVIPWHVIEELPRVNGKPMLTQKWIEITRTIDWGYGEESPGWCGWFAHLPDGAMILFKEALLIRKTPEMAAKLIVSESEGMKVRYTVGDPIMGWEREGESIAETLRKNGVWMIEADNDRPNGWMRVHSWLQGVIQDSEVGRPKLQILSSCQYAIRTLPTLQVDPKKPLDIIQGEGVDDHAADAIRYALMARPSPSRVPRRRGFPGNVPREIREAMFGSDRGEILGSESVRRP